MSYKISAYSYSLGLLSFLIALNPSVKIHANKTRNTFTNNQEKQTPFKDSTPSFDIAQNPLNNQDENIVHPGDRIAKKIRNNLFVIAQVTNSRCFVGEALMVTYKLYSRLNAKSSIVRQPALNGFSTRDLPGLVSLDKSTENLGGKSFQVYILRKTQLIPLVSGSLEIDPMEVEHKINFIKSTESETGSGNQLTDLMNQMKREETDLSLPLTIKTHSMRVPVIVNELPESNKPPDFSGAVGTFTIHAGILAEKSMVGEKATIRIEIKGKGNLSLIEPPLIQFPNGIEFFNVRRVLLPENPSLDFKTSRIFEYTVVLQKKGPIKIPSVSFSYFDPSGKSYKIIRTTPISFEVYENKRNSSGKIVPTPKPSMSREIRPDSIIRPKKSAILLVVIIAAFIALLSRKLDRFIKTQTIDMEKEQAIHSINKETSLPQPPVHCRLNTAKALLESKDFTSFYHELNKALWIVITEKLNLLPTELNKQNIFKELTIRGWTKEDNQGLQSAMDEFERNLYVPGYRDETDYEAVFTNALRIISKLDRL